MVSTAAAQGWRQRAVVAAPADDPQPAFAELSSEDVKPLVFGSGELDFPVPGMSDVMPYPSTRFSSMAPKQLKATAMRGATT